MTESHRPASGNLHDTTVGGKVVRSRIWFLLLACAAVLLLAHGGAVTSGYFSDVETSADNVLRVKNAPLFGAADSFAVLAGSTVTNTGTTTVTGDLGLSPGTAVVGIVPGDVTGTIYVYPDDEAVQAKLALTTAYNDAASRAGDTIGSALGGVLLPGVYDGGALGLAETLTLSGDENAVWIIKASSTLDTAADSVVVLSGGARAANVYWVVGSSATLGANSTFKGNIMAYASITLYAGADVEGRVLTQIEAVTLNSNTIARPAQ
jgi:predicted ribosomally synthesized peptide with SipW-like signal peptide